MSTLLQSQSGIHALCVFDADAAAAAFRSQRGFANPGFVRNGAGDYTLTLSEGIAQAAACILAGLQGAADGSIVAVWLTATTIQVLTNNAAGAAADIDFQLAVLDVGPT